MDLGIKGKRAIVCASSKGLGRGVAEHLAEAGVNLTLIARNEAALRDTADTISAAHGVHVQIVVGDVTTAEAQQRLLAAEPNADILITNAGGPPPGNWADWDRDAWQRAIDATMLAPILLTTAVLPGMIERRWGRVVNITSSAVKSPIPDLGLSNAARSGLTGFVAGTSRQVAQHGVTINNLLPGSHQTDRIETLLSGAATRQNLPLEQVRAEAFAANPTGRFGTPQEFGAIAAFLCSQMAGFIVGQNVLVDGGAFRSTL